MQIPVAKQNKIFYIKIISQNIFYFSNFQILSFLLFQSGEPFQKRFASGICDLRGGYRNDIMWHPIHKYNSRYLHFKIFNIIFSYKHNFVNGSQKGYKKSHKRSICAKVKSSIFEFLKKYTHFKKIFLSGKRYHSQNELNVFRSKIFVNIFYFSKTQNLNF